MVFRGVASEWGIEVRDVGLAWVAANTEVVLHAAFGGEPVVVPAHGIEDRLAGHPLIASDRVGVGVGEDVPHVQGAGDGRRGCVDGEDTVAVARPVEAVDLLAIPGVGPARLDAVEGGFVGDGHHVGQGYGLRSGLTRSGSYQRVVGRRPPQGWSS